MVQEFKQREVQSSGQTPGFQQVQFRPDAFGAGIGKALTQLGAGIDALAAVQEEKKANDAQNFINQANEELRPWLYDPQDGIYAKQGGNAIGSNQQLSVVLDDIQNRYIDQIEDPQTQQVFQKLWDRKTESVKDSVARHELSEFGTYKANTVKGTLVQSITDAYNGFNDEEQVALAISNSVKIVRANSAGLPPEVVAAAEAEQTSKIHLAVISRWASEDPYKALDYYQRVSESLSGQDHVTATQLVDAARANRKAVENAARISSVGGGARGLYSLIEQAESSGNPNAVSPAGAIGVMQLMPDTARMVAEELGLPEIASMEDAALETFLKDRPDVNRQLGRKYFDDQLRAFGGDVEAALVAYNAGPAWAEKFLRHNAGKAPGERDYNVPGNTKLKSETEPYVQKILGAYGVGNLGPTPPGLRMTRENWSLRNFKPSDIMAVQEEGQWVDARAAQGLDSLADRMNARFPGLKVSVNEPHDFSGPTEGRRRGTRVRGDRPSGGAQRSQHFHGTAFDVQVQGWSEEQKTALITEARSLGFRGFGFYGPDGHLHIDMGKERTWGKMPEWAREAMKTPIGQAPVADGSTQLPPMEVSGGSTLQNFYGVGGSGPSGYFIDTAKPDINAWLAEAQLIPDATERERTIAHLRVLEAQMTSSVEREAAAVKQQAWDTVINGSVADLGPELLSRLDPSFVNTLSSFESSRESGGPETDWEAWTDISLMEPEELLKIDPYGEYRARLADAEFKKLLEMIQTVKKARTGEAGAAAALGNLRSRKEVINDIAAEQSWDTRTNAGKKEIANFSRILDGRMAAEAQIKNRELNAIEIQDIADKLLIEDRHRRMGFFGGQGRALEVEEPNSFVAASEWDEVQQDDQELLIATYRELWNIDPDREAATDLYNRAMQVWLGGKPTGPDDEQEILRENLERSLSRTLTNSEFERYYAKYLLKFLGR